MQETAKKSDRATMLKEEQEEKSYLKVQASEKIYSIVIADPWLPHACLTAQSIHASGPCRASSEHVCRYLPTH
jgi:hypothetical protein